MPKQFSLADLKEWFKATYEYDDYAEVAFTDVETSYTIGTNANSAKAGSWPDGVPAKSILLYADQDCYIRFNDSSAVQHRIIAGNFFHFSKRTTVIYVVRVATSGTLYIWAEG
jgi:hypothetical protein